MEPIKREGESKLLYAGFFLFVLLVAHLIIPSQVITDAKEDLTGIFFSRSPMVLPRFYQIGCTTGNGSKSCEGLQTLPDVLPDDADYYSIDLIVAEVPGVNP